MAKKNAISHGTWAKIDVFLLLGKDASNIFCFFTLLNCSSWQISPVKFLITEVVRPSSVEALRFVIKCWTKIVEINGWIGL